MSDSANCPLSNKKDRQLENQGKSQSTVFILKENKFYFVFGYPARNVAGGIDRRDANAGQQITAPQLRICISLL